MVSPMPKSDDIQDKIGTQVLVKDPDTVSPSGSSLGSLVRCYFNSAYDMVYVGTPLAYKPCRTVH